MFTGDTSEQQPFTRTMTMEIKNSGVKVQSNNFFIVPTVQEEVPGSNNGYLYPSGICCLSVTHVYKVELRAGL